MESVLGRYRNLIILVGVLFLQVLGLAVQVKRSGDPENTRLIRIWAVDAITPFERALVWVQTGSGNLWHNYFYLRGVRAENRELKQEIENMRLEEVRLSEDAEQAHRLQKLLAFKEQVIGKPLAAQVIGTSGSDLSQCIYIDKGSDDGIKPDMAVITADGIVGKVLHAYPTTAQVLMINDQTSGVGAMLEKSRLQGVLKGTPDGSIVLERVMSDEKVSPGDTVISSGGDQIFPKGLPVGTVTKVSPGHEMFLNIQVKPAADLSRLEEVLVVTEKQDREAATENAGRVRAADILAQRLPSVPDKPPDTATPGGAANKPGMTAAAQAAVKPPGSATAASAKPESAQQTGAAPGAATVSAQKNATSNNTSLREVSSQAKPVSGTAGPAQANPRQTGSSQTDPSQTDPSQTKKVAPEALPSASPSAAGLGGGAANAPKSTIPAQGAAGHPKPAAPPSDSQQAPTQDDPH
jgi:rod shape-determining protein MreC